MSNEVERKFLVAELPCERDLGRGVAIRQGYLAEEGDVELRLRITDEHAVLTVKAGRGLSRLEIERDVTADEAELLWPHTAGRRVSKVRYRIDLGDAGDGGPAEDHDGRADDARTKGHTLVAEVDVYGGSLEGLQTVEVEFESVDAADRFEPCSWFGEELTGDKAWSNASLARHGRPHH